MSANVGIALEHLNQDRDNCYALTFDTHQQKYKVLHFARLARGENAWELKPYGTSDTLEGCLKDALVLSFAGSQPHVLSTY